MVGTIKQVPVIKTDRDSSVVEAGVKYCSNNIHDLKAATYVVSSEEGEILYC